ncbi:MAG TPA: transporter substrate-binding domain-containing protein [Thermoanaerobaculia bacterium]|nr:transporter substrate-binding domain-containing protein [Thermoanaerobaculia bacterium]
MRRRAAALAIGLLALAGPGRAAPPGGPGLVGRVWRVGIFEAPPYAMHGADGQWKGLLVELWAEVASELDIQYRFGEASPDEILDDLAHDRLDIAVAPFATTIERERTVDFTHAFLIQDMAIAVRKGGDEERWLLVARALTTPTAIRLYVGITLLVFVAGTAIWLLERRRNPQFSGSAFQGMGSGFWWSGVTTVAVGYGDKVPITLWGRLVALFWMFLSLILVTAFAAFVTAKLAVAEFGQVRGASTLHSGVVGTVEGAAVGELLRRERIRHRVYSSIPKALQGLRSGEVNAVVYGASILEYFVQRETRKDLEVLPQMFDQQILAFPVPDGSPLRDPVNGVLRRFLPQPGWRDLQDKYLSSADTSAQPKD